MEIWPAYLQAVELTQENSEALPTQETLVSIQGVAAPMAQFTFSGWKDSFFGDLHGQGRHAIEFFTQTKVVIERWPKEWLRKF